MQPLVSIVILTWNGKACLEKCLSSLFEQSYENFRTVLVDNNSTDGSVEFVRQNFPKVDILVMGKNYGVTIGFNIGIKYAMEKHRPDYVLMLNNDIKFIKNDAIEKLVEAGQDDEKTGILGCILLFPDGKVQHIGTELYKNEIRSIPLTAKIPDKPYEVYAFTGAVFLIKKAVIDKIGLLDEGFAPFQREETDYCVRARKSGYRVKVVPTAEVIHYNSKSMINLPCGYVTLICKRNQIRFMLLNYSLIRILMWLFKDLYFLLKTFPHLIFERRDKLTNPNPCNLKIKEDYRKNLAVSFDPYTDNIRNLGDILLKRMNRTGKLWF
jgi:GT2 family glycosyltransferase